MQFLLLCFSDFLQNLLLQNSVNVIILPRWFSAIQPSYKCLFCLKTFTFCFGLGIELKVAS